MELIDDSEEPKPGGSNRPAPGDEFTVSGLSAEIKRRIEGDFPLVRVRGEVSKVSRPVSGHLYFDLKDDRAVLAAVSWKGQAARLTQRPEEGMEVIATGRLTTFPGQSKYQLVVEDLALAGAGALMAMLEKRRQALAAEGLFDAGRKKPIPYLPKVIGVITSPSGAVIRDILHRLAERFPRHVLVWPVAVQGEKCAAEVAAAIAGFNALPPGGPIPRPDLLIVARGGGSLEDLWGFNDEGVVRAAAASAIPLIAAVGHETDHTLIDLAADLRAPTPTAAAEKAVPVRGDLLAALAALGARLEGGLQRGLLRRRERLRDKARALPAPERLVQSPAQRLDLWAGRLVAGRERRLAVARERMARGARLQPALLRAQVKHRREGFEAQALRLARALGQAQKGAEGALKQGAHRFAALGSRLGRRLQTESARLALAAEAGPLAFAAGMKRREAALAQAERLRRSLGYRETLARGFAVVRAGARVLTTQAAAAAAPALEIEFQDGRLPVQPQGGAAGGAPPAPSAPAKPAKPLPKAGDTGQGQLF